MPSLFLFYRLAKSIDLPALKESFMKKIKMKKFSILFSITVLSIIGYFEISISQAEKLFWLRLGM